MSNSTARRSHGALRQWLPADRAGRRTWTRSRAERGDVPGWVMVTLMTAGLVITIWALAGGALANVFQTAMDRVLGV